MKKKKEIKPIKKKKIKNSKKSTIKPKTSDNKVENKADVKIEEKKIEIKNEIRIDAKLSLDEEKIKEFLDIGHLYELLYLISILKNEEIKNFIEHYKQNAIKSRDDKIDRLIRNSKSEKDLILNLKKELTNTLNEDYIDLRKEISIERKKGVDLYIEDITSMSIPLKIRMYSATMKKEDYYKIKKIFEDVRNSIKLKKEIFEKEKVEKDRFFWAMKNRDMKNSGN